MAEKKDSTVSDVNTKDDKNKSKGVKTHSNENKCPICLEQISNRCLTDSCGHHFCFSCLSRWSRDHNYCPVCRQVYEKIGQIGLNNRFNWMPIHNRETILRRSLLEQRDSLRRQLIRIRSQREEEIQSLVERIQRRQQMRDRISDEIMRIDSIDGQNNEEIDHSLNQIRNTINENNFEDFRENPFSLRAFIPQRHPNRNRDPLVSTRSNDSLRVNTSLSSGRSSESSVNSRPSLSLNSSSSEESIDINPRTIEYQIFSPNSVQNIRISSSDSNNGSVRAIRSTFIQRSEPEEEDNLMSHHMRVSSDNSKQNLSLDVNMNEEMNQFMDRYFGQRHRTGLQFNGNYSSSGSQPMNTNQSLNGFNQRQQNLDFFGQNNQQMNSQNRPINWRTRSLSQRYQRRRNY